MAKKDLQSCIECGDNFKGRIDKRFCSDQCRATFNNRTRRLENQMINGVNAILRKNRRILIGLNPKGKNKVSRDKLKSKGFDFGFFTSIYKTKEGAQYYYCYDQGYLPIDKDQCLLVIKKEF